jgi:hypothetical protein
VFSVHRERLPTAVSVHLVPEIIDQNGFHAEGRGTDGEQPDAAQVAHGAPGRLPANDDREAKCDPGHVGVLRGAPSLRVLVREAMEERPHVRRARERSFRPRKADLH